VSNPRLSDAAASAAADTVSMLLDDGTLRIYDGVQPRGSDSMIDGQTLLAELRFASPASLSAEKGVVRFHDLVAATAVATGEATWFRASGVGGNTVLDGSVGTRDANLVLNESLIKAGASVAVVDFTYTQKKG
jgi:hypothetical protein